MAYKKEWEINKFENEDQFQVASMIMIRREFPRLKNKAWHTKNEGKIPKAKDESEDDYEIRRMKEGGINKAKGVLAGVPDICIRYKGISYGIELKQPSKTPSKSQKELHMDWALDNPMIPVKICYTVAEVYNYCKWIMENKFKIIKTD